MILYLDCIQDVSGLVHPREHFPHLQDDPRSSVPAKLGLSSKHSLFEGGKEVMIENIMQTRTENVHEKRS